MNGLFIRALRARARASVCMCACVCMLARVCVRENGLFDNCAKNSSNLPVKLYAMHGMQATAGFSRPLLRVVRVCVRLATYYCVYLIFYTAPKFPYMFY